MPTVARRFRLNLPLRPLWLLPKHYFISTTKGKNGRSYAHYPLVGLASAENDMHTKVYTCMKAYTRTSSVGVLTSQVPCLTRSAQPVFRSVDGLMHEAVSRLAGMDLHRPY